MHICMGAGFSRKVEEVIQVSLKLNCLLWVTYRNCCILYGSWFRFGLWLQVKQTDPGGGLWLQSADLCHAAWNPAGQCDSTPSYTHDLSSPSVPKVPDGPVSQMLLKLTNASLLTLRK